MEETDRVLFETVVSGLLGVMNRPKERAEYEGFVYPRLPNFGSVAEARNALIDANPLASYPEPFRRSCLAGFDLEAVTTANWPLIVQAAHQYGWIANYLHHAIHSVRRRASISAKPSPNVQGNSLWTRFVIGDAFRGYEGKLASVQRKAEKAKLKKELVRDLVARVFGFASTDEFQDAITIQTSPNHIDWMMAAAAPAFRLGLFCRWEPDRHLHKLFFVLEDVHGAVAERLAILAKKRPLIRPVIKSLMKLVATLPPGENILQLHFGVWETVFWQMNEQTPIHAFFSMRGRGSTTMPYTHQGPQMAAYYDTIKDVERHIMSRRYRHSPVREEKSVRLYGGHFTVLIHQNMSGGPSDWPPHPNALLWVPTSVSGIFVGNEPPYLGYASYPDPGCAAEIVIKGQSVSLRLGSWPRGSKDFGLPFLFVSSPGAYQLRHEPSCEALIEEWASDASILQRAPLITSWDDPDLVRFCARAQLKHDEARNFYLSESGRPG